MLPQNNPDRITIIFDDHRLVANAELLLPATLSLHLGLGELVDHHLNLGSAPGRANTGDKMMTLVASEFLNALAAIDTEILEIQTELNQRLETVRHRRQPLEVALAHLDALLRIEGHSHVCDQPTPAGCSSTKPAGSSEPMP